MQEREYDVTTTQGKTTLWVDSDRIDNCLSYFREHHIDSLGVNPVRGYRLNHLDFLQRCTDLVSLQIVFAPSFKFDLSPLMAVVGLESLTLSTDVPLLLDHFPRLKEFRGIWHPKLQLSGCPKLQTLNLSNYKCKAGDLTGLPEMPAVQDLGLVQSAVTSLRGLARFARLVRLELAYLTRLTSLDEILQLPELE